MEETRSYKKIKESDSKEGYPPEDEASYYLGNNFEMGGVEFGPDKDEKEPKDKINDTDGNAPKE